MKLQEPLDSLPEIPSAADLMGHREELADPLLQFRVLLRFKWQILGMIVLCVLATAFVVFLIKPVYRGTATLLIEPRSANIVKIQEVYEPDRADWTAVSEYQKTQIELLKSRVIAEQVFTELKLDQHPEFAPPKSGIAAPRLLDDLKALIKQYAPKTSSPGKIAGPEVDLLSRKLSVEPVLDTNLVKVHADAQDPELSARIANAVVDTYIRYDQQSRGGITDQATGWLNQRLQEIKTDLEHSEKALQAFYDTEQLVNVGGARGLVEDEMTDNAQRLREARKVKTELENVYRRIVEARNSMERLQEIPAILQEPLVEATKKSYLDAQREVGGLESRYGRKHPKMIAARARLTESQAAYNRQLVMAADGIRSQYEIAQNTESSVASIVQGSKSQIQGLDRKQNKLEILQRDVESNRKLYDTFLERSKETDIAGNLDIGKVRIVEQAMVPRWPYKPRKRLWLLSAMMLGLFLGVAIALLRGYLDDTIKTPLDLEQITGIPVLTVLPLVRKTGKRGERLVHMEVAEPGAIFSEGIRTLRTSVLLADASRKRSRILLTSAVPAEGKTSVALNLAMALGQVDRVVLVDADLRKPNIGAKLQLAANSKGLADILIGSASLDDCIYRHTEGNIDVLPGGIPPPNPLELFSSQRFADFLKVLSERYDRIVIDSAPCYPVSDSLLLARCVDAVIFLAKADSTPKRLVNTSIKQLRKAGAPLVGAVLNQADIKHKSGFAYGYYYYRGGYGSYKATT